MTLMSGVSASSSISERYVVRSMSFMPVLRDQSNPFPKFEKTFILGNYYFYFCCLTRKLMVARVLRLRMSVIREKGRQSSPSHCRYEAATKSMSSCLLCTSSFR